MSAIGAAGHAVWELAISLLQGIPAGDLLEAAAGGGPMAAALASKGFHVVGADLVNQWQQPDAGFVVIDLDDRLPFADGSFDVVTLVEGLGYLENPSALFREFRRVLRPGGCFILTVPNCLSLQSRVRFLLNGTFRWFPHPPTDIRRKSEMADTYRDPLRVTTLMFLLQCQGFQVERITFGGTKSTLAALPFCWLLGGLTSIHNRARKGRGKETPPFVNSTQALLCSNVGVRARAPAALENQQI